MTTTLTQDINDRNGAAQAVVAPSESELAALMSAYGEVTDRLKESHEILRREVCRLRDQLHEKNIELQRSERLAALGQMAAGVAHEIRNPLGGIRLYTSLLERDLSSQPKQLDIARRIGVGIRNLENIVGDILAFASGSALRYVAIHLSDLFDAVCVQAAAVVAETGAELHVSPSARTLEVECDASQIERALINLVFNGLEAAGKAGHVWVDAHEDGDEAVITINDDGPGISAEDTHRVFNPFFTTKDAGTGLGLAIVYRIAEQHGGQVTASNRQGGGASFSLRIPKLRVCAADHRS